MDGRLRDAATKLRAAVEQGKCHLSFPGDLRTVRLGN
jgi:hypothetical protein